VYSGEEEKESTVATVPMLLKLQRQYRVDGTYPELDDWIYTIQQYTYNTQYTYTQHNDTRD